MNFPKFISDNEQLNKVYEIAVNDIESNVKKYRGGALTSAKNVFIAGEGYIEPWTRDASINVWNGLGLFTPEISKNTLLAVLENDGGKQRVGGQYWDAIVWVTGAYAYYLFSGDDKFMEEAHRQILIRDLFTMTSGMDYDYNAEEIKNAVRENPDISTAEMIKVFAKRPLIAHPGEKFNYGFSHDVLARLIEVWSGMRFSDYVEKSIFKPLGMKSSTFKVSEMQGKLAWLYKYNYETRQSERYYEGNHYLFSENYESGGAGMASTIDDYLRFLEGLKNGKLISKCTLRFMATNQLSDDQIRSSKKWWVFYGFGYGLGVKVHNDQTTSDNNAPLGIFGWSGAAGSMPMIDLKNDLTIMYVQHMLYDNQGEFESRLINVIYSCLGNEVDV